MSSRMASGWSRAACIGWRRLWPASRRASAPRFRYDAEVREVASRSGRVAGVTLADGERFAADAVVVNADIAAVAAGLLGRARRPRRAGRAALGRGRCRP